MAKRPRNAVPEREAEKVKEHASQGGGGGSHYSAGFFLGWLCSACSFTCGLICPEWSSGPLGAAVCERGGWGAGVRRVRIA